MFSAGNPLYKRVYPFLSVGLIVILFPLLLYFLACMIKMLNQSNRQMGGNYCEQ